MPRTRKDRVPGEVRKLWLKALGLGTGLALAGLLLCSHLGTDDSVAEVLAHRGEVLTGRFTEVPCSDDYDSHRRFEGCTPRKCGRGVTDVVISREEAERIRSVAEKGLSLGGSDGGASILDLHSGALSFGKHFVNLYRYFGDKVQSIFSEEDFQLYRDLRWRVQLAIAQAFGVSASLLHLTRPTFFSRINSTDARTAHDEYWHAHVDKDAAGPGPRAPLRRSPAPTLPADVIERAPSHATSMVTVTHSPAGDLVQDAGLGSPEGSRDLVTARQATALTDPMVPETTDPTAPTAPETTDPTAPTAPETTDLTAPTAPETTAPMAPETTDPTAPTAPETTDPTAPTAPETTDPTVTLRVPESTVTRACSLVTERGWACAPRCLAGCGLQHPGSAVRGTGCSGQRSVSVGGCCPVLGGPGHGCGLGVTSFSSLPLAGRVSFFTSGSENLHRVEKVRWGTRYAITIAFTCNPDHGIEDPTLL
ncbi:PREDICTED: 2-oxoglutarate and iron-dependent oxygenase domain-containing protein 3 [Dipodomys ordii]|uniref:2-oxoglutarate and iron-dependent oxygenase domain-containing protein 3 n=1 Tax=Dipodomys ordii TaxID=10020 RepID=A0A1S3GIB6_DIPOR|nr:PREDICTED: 2-oxoglutarate and iron-dependent oxygenase domain-containing protein 3 [Dipodomys ordii]